MATTSDLNDDLNLGMAEVRRTLEHYNLGEWQEYLLIRQKGRPQSFIVLAHPSDKGDFDERLIQFHKDESHKETVKPPTLE